MPSRVRNTVERDNLLILMRAARASWDDIAAALGVSRSWAIERGHRIGAKMQPKAAAESARKRTVKALPEGHDCHMEHPYRRRNARGRAVSQA
jgi:hypothetical protein